MLNQETGQECITISEMLFPSAVNEYEASSAGTKIATAVHAHASLLCCASASVLVCCSAAAAAADVDVAIQYGK